MGPVEAEARRLPWAAERLWTVGSHLGTSNGLPLLDFHALSVRLALNALEVACDTDLATGGVVVITGRGRHTGGHSKLRTAVMAWLDERQESGDLAWRVLDPGRLEVVFDQERVRGARPGMGVLFWLFVALLLLAIAAVVLNRL